MENYYSSARLLTVTLIVLAITCVYVGINYFEQSLVLRKSRLDFAWWFVFSQLEKNPQSYRDFKADTSGRKPIFLYAYYEPVGYCFAKEQSGKLLVQISRHDFDMSKIEPSFYAPIDDMPAWQIDLDLRNYEPTMITDLVLALIQQASKEQGGKLDQDALIPQRLGQEEIKRLKQLRGDAQFFNLEIKENSDGPTLYRGVQKEFQKQKVKIPALDLDFFALSAVWIMAILAAILGALLDNQVEFISAKSVLKLHDPWIVFDATRLLSRAVSTLWLLSLALCPICISATLIYMSYASAWIDGFVRYWPIYLATGVAIAIVSAVSFIEISHAALALKRIRDEYWDMRAAHRS
jgi:hypothetical protein